MLRLLTLLLSSSKMNFFYFIQIFQLVAGFHSVLLIFNFHWVCSYVLSFDPSLFSVCFSWSVLVMFILLTFLNCFSFLCFLQCVFVFWPCSFLSFIMSSFCFLWICSCLLPNFSGYILHIFQSSSLSRVRLKCSLLRTTDIESDKCARGMCSSHS